MAHIDLLDLGFRDYGATWSLQRELVVCRQQDEIGDTLVLVEHPHVITIGRRVGACSNILQRGDIPVFAIERGGDVTYHGPGQLVGYPLLRLGGPARDLHRYLRNLETVLIRTCQAFGVEAVRREGATGAWVEDRKLASIGVAVKRWVTLHGFALNVSTDLQRFSAINPCGLQANVMTSLERETGRNFALDEVKRMLVRYFREVFL